MSNELRAQQEESSDPLWYWHDGMQAIVCRPLDGTNNASAFGMNLIAASGFQGDADGFRRSLPLFGAPQLARTASAHDVAQAAAVLRAQNELGRKMRGR